MDNCCKYILINTFDQQTIQKVLRYNVTLVFFYKKTLSLTVKRLNILDFMSSTQILKYIRVV